MTTDAALRELVPGLLGIYGDLIDRDRFKEWEATLPFYQSIRKEGVVLWPAA